MSRKRTRSALAPPEVSEWPISLAFGRELKDSAVREAIRDVVSPEPLGGIAVVDSLYVETLLRRERDGRLSSDPEERREQVFKICGLDRFGGVAELDVVAFVLCARHHWSVLCYFTARDEAVLYDSLNGMTISVAREVMKIVADVGVASREAVRRVEVPRFFPVQRGSWECGYYAVGALDGIKRKRLRGRSWQPLSEADVVQFVSEEAILGDDETSLRERMREELNADTAYMNSRWLH
jgi:hypothetical protein